MRVKRRNQCVILKYIQIANNKGYKRFGFILELSSAIKLTTSNFSSSAYDEKLNPSQSISRSSELLLSS